MEKRKAVLGLIVLSLAALLLLVLLSRTCTVEADLHGGGEDAASYTAVLEDGIAEITDIRIKTGRLLVDLSPVRRGSTDILIHGPDGFSYMDKVYVHAFGMMTVNTFFGRCRGAAVIPAAFLLLFAYGLYALISRYRKNVRENLYDYGNVRDLGLILFLAAGVVNQVLALFGYNAIDSGIRIVFNTANLASFLVLPVAFVVSLLVTASNVLLLRREGFTWRNMLGCILGVLVCLGTFLPDLIYNWLTSVPAMINLHNLNSPGPYVYLAVEEIIYFVIAYLECILAATIWLSVKAARAVPSFDKDYILILGCQIRKDGTPTPLLKGRADRALEFARLQKEAGGGSVVFVPSGGQGGDEVISEAEAVRNYLKQQGIPEERILTEDRSRNTEENFRNSMQIIREKDTGTPRIAFSTTNYHVFRSGITASEQGIRAEGIGSRTRSYFWINAFVREFIASVYAQRRRHLRLLCAMAVLILLMVAVQCVSNLL